MSTQTLKWRFDVNAFRLLGRELITDRITALVELVKNSYDANTQSVHVEFYNVGRLSANSKIIIRDDGIGMSLEDVQNKWMVVGTNSKRISEHSPKPYKRKYIGEKGIGRFAVDKLGGHLLMITQTSDSSEELRVEINWDEYEKLAGIKDEQLTLFTEVENNYQVIEGIEGTHGTTLIISNLHEIWGLYDIERAYKELSKIVSPFHPVNPPFRVYIYSNEFPKDFNKKLAKSKAVEYASDEFVLDFDLEKQQQQTLYFNKKKGKFEEKWIPIQEFGPVKLRLFYFNTEAKRNFNRAYKKTKLRIDGIKIYRDGILTTPFAEYEANPYQQKDILGIDKRLWESTYDRIGSREIIGILDITKRLNPQIKDTTNRQYFVVNKAYKDLKGFIIDQLDEISKYKVYKRNEKKKEAMEALFEVNTEMKGSVKELKSYIKKVKKGNPFMDSILDELENKINNTSNVVQKVVKTNKEIEKEVERKENLYLSLMSLQEYAANLAHAVRTSLGKIKRMAEFFKNKYPDARYEKLFSSYSLRIYDEMNTLGNVIDFMLSYAKSNIEIETFSFKEVIDNLFYDIYKHVFEVELIEGIVDIRDDFLINSNQKFFEDIFENLISNSIKALEKKEHKVIKCSGGIEGNYFVCYFSDNGEGIQKGDEEKIFEIYYTTTAERGGAGLGLFIVQQRIEALKGTIEVVKSEFNSGATFKISLPIFKK